MPSHYLQVIDAMEQKYDLIPGVLTKLIKIESEGFIDAKSPKGAIGLTQLMPETAKELGVDPNDTAQNIEGGAKYLRQQLTRFNGDYAQALGAYNAGPNNKGVKDRDWEALPEETKDYLQNFKSFVSRKQRPDETYTGAPDEGIERSYPIESAVGGAALGKLAAQGIGAGAAKVSRVLEKPRELLSAYDKASTAVGKTKVGQVYSKIPKNVRALLGSQAFLEVLGNDPGVADDVLGFLLSRYGPQGARGLITDLFAR